MKVSLQENVHLNPFSVQIVLLNHVIIYLFATEWFFSLKT